MDGQGCTYAISPSHRLRVQPPMWPLLLLPLLLLLPAAANNGADAPWPDRFHAVLVTNQTWAGGRLQLVDVYYDWPRGRSLELARDQLSGDGEALWSVEWANGTAFVFDGARAACQTYHFTLEGLLPPDWKKKAPGTAYLGRRRVDGFDCHVWSNFVFPRYYEDVATGRPVSWTFNGPGASYSTGMQQRHVLSFEERE